MAKASAISAPLLGHQRYTVALPTAARSATPSIVRSAKPLLPSTFNVLRRIAWRAFSLRGRPGGRFPFAFSRYEAANNLWRMNIRYHIIQATYLESDTVSIESKSSLMTRWGSVLRHFVRLERVVPHVDCCTGPTASLYVCRDGDRDFNPYADHDPAHSHRYLS